MADRLLEIRLVIPAEDDLHPDIVRDDFIADLRSEWNIVEASSSVVSGQTEETT